MRYAIALFLLLVIRSPLAGSVEIISARVEHQAGSYRFHVTLKHADSGWQHYANAWRVLAPDGRVLGERILYHPHVDEQPFTRALSGVILPPGTDYVEIEAEDSQHGVNSQRLRLDLPR